MNDKRSSIVGFALIGIILLLFTWYNSKQAEKRLQQENMVRDSLATVAALEGSTSETEEPAADAADAARNIPEENDYQDQFLREASLAETEWYTLENDKLAVKISSKGAQPYEVRIKNYYTYDSLDLFLVHPDKSLFDLELNTNQWLNTSDLHFRAVENTDSTLTLRLQFEEDAWVDAIYSLASDSHTLGYHLHFVGMDKVLDRRTGQMTLKWVLDVPRLEKGYQNERNYSGVAYKYLANNEVKTLGKRRDHAEEHFNSTIRWFGFQQQFFSAILVAENGFPAGTLVNRFYPENDAERNLMQSGAEMTVALDTRS